MLKDYFGQRYSEIQRLLEKFDLDTLLETQDISDILFNEIHDRKISPKGLRILKKTNIPERFIDSLVAHFGTLEKILSSRYEDLLKVFQNEGMVDFFKEELYGLREKISLGKKI